MKQQELRKWADQHVNASDWRTMSAEEQQNLAAGISQALLCIDLFWEAANGRKLTHEEKYGT